MYIKYEGFLILTVKRGSCIKHGNCGGNGNTVLSCVLIECEVALIYKGQQFRPVFLVMEF